MKTLGCFRATAHKTMRKSLSKQDRGETNTTLRASDTRIQEWQTARKKQTARRSGQNVGHFQLTLCFVIRKKSNEILFILMRCDLRDHNKQEF